MKSVWKLAYLEAKLDLMTGFENRFWKQALNTGLNQLHFYLDWIELLEKKILKILKIKLTIKNIFHVCSWIPSHQEKAFF